MVSLPRKSAVSRCPDCQAELEEGRACIEYFHEMLALEAEVPGGPTGIAHFFAVACYNVQHPSMFVHGIVEPLAESLSDAVLGRADIAKVRARARHFGEGPTRILRRADEPATRPEDWPRAWPMTVRDLCRIAPDEYNATAERWARAVTATLAARNNLGRSIKS